MLLDKCISNHPEHGFLLVHQELFVMKHLIFCEITIKVTYCPTLSFYLFSVQPQHLMKFQKSGLLHTLLSVRLKKLPLAIKRY